MKVKPTTKIKRRYILFNSNNKEEIEKIILDYIGILGYAEAAPVFLNYKDKLVLAVERKSLNRVRAAFEIAETDIEIRRVSGRLKGLCMRALVKPL